MDVVIATSIQRRNYYINFDIDITTLHQRCGTFAKSVKCGSSTLWHLCEECQMWIIHGSVVTFLQFCLRVVKKINNDMTFVCYTRLIMWYRIQTIVSFSHFPSHCFQKLVLKGSERWTMISWSLTAWHFPRTLEFVSIS